MAGGTIWILELDITFTDQFEMSVYDINGNGDIEFGPAGQPRFDNVTYQIQDPALAQQIEPIQTNG